MAIIQISNETKNKIKAKSVYTLPDNPSERGVSASVIKTRQVAPMLDESNSILSEINRIVDETNTELNTKVNGIEGKGLSKNDYTDEAKNLVTAYGTNKTSYDDAVTKKHEHANGSILENTTASFTSAEKDKLSNIESGANNYVHPSGIGTANSTKKLYKVAYDNNGHISDVEEYVIPNASTSNDGFMSSSDKVQLDLIVSAYNDDSDGNNTIDKLEEILAAFESMPEASNLVAMFGGKVDKVNGKGLSTNDFTNELKNKLDGISGNGTSVQADWNQSISSEDDYIKNKPLDIVLNFSSLPTISNAEKTSALTELNKIVDNANEVMLSNFNSIVLKNISTGDQYHYTSLLYRSGLAKLYLYFQYDEDSMMELYVDFENVEMTATLKNTAVTNGVDGNSVYVKYSSNADGTGFSDTPSSTTKYIGVMTGASASALKGDYRWIKFVGENGLNGSDGTDGTNGTDGKSAYQLAVDNGYVGTLNEWLLSLKGTNGTNGADGTDGYPNIILQVADINSVTSQEKTAIATSLNSIISNGVLSPEFNYIVLEVGTIPLRYYASEISCQSTFTTIGFQIEKGTELSLTFYPSNSGVSFSTSIVSSPISQAYNVSAWASDTTYADYGYRASITFTGATASSVFDVIFPLAQAISGNYAPICESYNGGVYLYSKVNTSVNGVVIVKVV